MSERGASEYAKCLQQVFARITDPELQLKAAGAALRAINEVVGSRCSSASEPMSTRQLPAGWRVIEGQRPA
jgi:hypothetical protein